MLKAEKRAAGSAMEEIAHTWTQDNMATGRQTLSHYGSEMGKPVNQALMLLLSQMTSWDLLPSEILNLKIASFG